MFKFQKILSAGAAAAVTMTALASGVCKIDKRSGHTEVLSGKYRLVTSNAKGNFAVSAFSVDGKEYMYYAGLSIKEKGGKVTYNEANTPAGKCTELRADAQEGKIFWQHKYEWDFVNMIRTIETGDYPGFKLTCDIEVMRDFEFERVCMSLRLPYKNVYNRTGYIKNGIIQFRPHRKAEWFAILKNQNFPYITFSGDTVKEAVMIAAGNMASWNRLPTTLLYSTNDKCYWTAEFMYQFGKTLKKGEKHSFSVYIIPISSDNVAGEAQENFIKIKNFIK